MSAAQPLATAQKIKVQTADLRAGLLATVPHVADDDYPSIHRVRCSVGVGGAGDMVVMATNRFTVGVSIVSVWEHATGEQFEFDLMPADVKSILFEFPPRKQVDDDDVLITVGPNEVTVQDASGLFPDASKALTLPRVPNEEQYPNLPALIRTTIERGLGGDLAADRLTVNSSLLQLFHAGAGRAYKGEPLVIEPGPDGKALVIACGESFLGLLMPMRPPEDESSRIRQYRAAWMSRLPQSLSSVSPIFRYGRGVMVNAVDIDRFEVDLANRAAQEAEDAQDDDQVPGQQTADLEPED